MPSDRYPSRRYKGRIRCDDMGDLSNALFLSADGSARQSNSADRSSAIGGGSLAQRPTLLVLPSHDGQPLSVRHAAWSRPRCRVSIRLVESSHGPRRVMFAAMAALLKSRVWARGHTPVASHEVLVRPLEQVGVFVLGWRAEDAEVSGVPPA
jgi:hypothetical protein